jgi:tRNA(adenine34) deaminase
MYVTLEPCQMCAGAIVQARIPRVVIGTMNPKAGCAGSVLDLLHVEQFNHQVDVVYDVLKEECSTMLSDFFRQLREWKKQQKIQQNKEDMTT